MKNQIVAPAPLNLSGTVNASDLTLSWNRPANIPVLAYTTKEQHWDGGSLQASLAANSPETCWKSWKLLQNKDPVNKPEFFTIKALRVYSLSAFGFLLRMMCPTYGTQPQNDAPQSSTKGLHKETQSFLSSFISHSSGLVI